MGESARRILSRVEAAYVRLFSIGEIRDNAVLQWMMGASTFFFFVIFNVFISSPVGTIDAAAQNRAVCWPIFPNCTDWYFLQSLPYHYSQTTFYMVLYGILALIVWRMAQKHWASAHALLVLLLAWEFVWVVGYSYPTVAPYYYYHLILTTILLFIPHKEHFLKLAFVMLYFLSATIKFDEGWVLGTYFSSLKTGLPLIPDVLIPVATNIVIGMQIIGCWFLLSSRPILQRLALSFFIFFHLYSGIFVMYLYPSTALPPLLILFGWMYRPTAIPVDRKSLAGWTIIALLIGFQAAGFLAPGDRRLTLQGDRLGMFMFDANHQCAYEFTTIRTPKKTTPEVDVELASGTPCNAFYCTVHHRVTQHDDGRVEEFERFESGTSWNRCDPYDFWFKMNNRCKRNPRIESIAMTFDHSINGGPFYRVVDVPDICSVTYTMFGTNEWLRSPPEAPIIGYPVTNYYHY